MPAKKKGPKAKAKSPTAAPSLFFWPLALISRLTRSWPAHTKWPARFAFSAAIYGSVLAGILSVVYFILSYTYDLDQVAAMPARTEIQDHNGKLLTNSQGKEIGFLHGTNRQIVTYDEVPPHFIEALIAQEDRRFRDHGAVDFRALARVALRAVTRGKLEGGGTISMQLARNSFDLKKNREGILKGAHRKLLETFIAIRIESQYSKNEILQHYMNRIFWGGSIRGVEVAARTYFDCSAKDLTLGQSALLVGILRAPNRFSPLRNPEGAILQRDWVLDKMIENNAITEAEAETAKKAPLNITSAQNKIREGSYALDAIRIDIDRVLEEENIRDGGLIIKTTIDPNLQEIAERAVGNRLAQFEKSPGYSHQKRANWDGQGAPQYLQAAAVVIENQTGAVLAIVGGRNPTESQFNRALRAQRPVGSLFKPFIHLAAFDQGLKPYDWVSDQRIKPGEIRNAEPSWDPDNADRKYLPRVTVKQSLVESRNTSTIRIGNHAGLEPVVEIARVAGFDTSRIPLVPSSFLGSFEATPEIVASAFTIFPNGGVRFRPYYVQSITDRLGTPLFTNGPIPYRATEAGPAWDVSQILEEVNQTGTGRSLRTTYGFRTPSGGKTGTTNGPRDCWYVGYTSALTCAIWVGLDQNEIISPTASGARLALPIWFDIMRGADFLPRYKAGPITPQRALILPPEDDEEKIPRAVRIDDEEDIPRAVAVDDEEDIPEALPVR